MKDERVDVQGYIGSEVRMISAVISLTVTKRDYMCLFVFSNIVFKDYLIFLDVLIFLRPDQLSFCSFPLSTRSTFPMCIPEGDTFEKLYQINFPLHCLLDQLLFVPFCKINFPHVYS